MSSTISPNMSLIIPTVGSEPGPDYGTDINSSLTLVDQHDHSPGKGVQITPAGLNINADLDFNDNAAIDVSSVGLVAQGSVPAVFNVYANGVDLYYVDGLGNNIRMTQSGGVAGTPGSIANLVAPASATYVSGSKTFVWQSGTSIAANMDAASLVMRNITPNSTFGLTLKPPAALSQNYDVTLPALPVANSFMQMSTLGVLSASVAVSHGLTADNIAVGTQIPLEIVTLVNSDSPYTVLTTDSIIACNTTSGSITVNLPAAASVEGRTYWIKKINGSNTVTIEPNGAETIDGQANYLLLGLYDYIACVSTGAAWLIIDRDIVQFLNTTTAPVAIPGTGDIWYAASGNSLTLPEGDWELTGKVTWGTTANLLTTVRTGWFGANGADTGATPAGISNAAILNGFQGTTGAGNNTNIYSNDNGGAQYLTAQASIMTIRVASGGSTVYLNAGSAGPTGGGIEYSINLNAKRLR